ncbi:MAG: DNA-directed RNA polymerase subunit beta [bacterium]
MVTNFRSVKRGRRNFAKIPEIMAVPNLIEIQKSSYEKFLQREAPQEARIDEGLQGVFKSVFPITDFSDTCSLEFVSYSFGEPKYSVKECHQRGMTYAAAIKVVVRLIVWVKNKEQQPATRSIRDIKEQEIYLGEIPLMTENGTFIINGTERAIVSQMHRSPGVFFGHDKGKTYSGQKIVYTARIIPYRGSWVEFEICSKDILYLRIDRRRKIIATVLLRAMGIESDEEILKRFYQTEKVILGEDNVWTKLLDPEAHIGERVSADIPDPQTGKVIVKANTKIGKANLKRMMESGIDRIPVEEEQLIGHYLASDIIDMETGEILFEVNSPVTVDTLFTCKEKGIHEIELLVIEGSKIGQSLRDTTAKDPIKTKTDALIDIYKRMRPGDPPTPESAQTLFNHMFFDHKRYDLSRVGRLIMNRRLEVDNPIDERLLTESDFMETIRYLLQLQNGYGYVDDIDHLGNRRVRSVGELLENQFRIGLVRMERAIRERMSIQDMETVMPHDIVNSKPVAAVIKEFFGSSQLSQFLDQTNPLSELTHKRRLSALGPGSLSRERAGFEVRDVHSTHYGRICPIETPEGPNIGLISSLSTFARVNEFGFIETPYRRVVNGQVTDEIVFLTASEEENYVVAQANAPIDENGYFLTDRVNVRQGGEFKKLSADQIDFMDVSPKQLVSVSTSLIPFLEHDDANRALMGSNMQRQAVPLLKPSAPLVGTGMEGIVARDSGAIMMAKRAGVVESVSANRIIIRADQEPEALVEGGGEPIMDIYELTKFQRSNQNTCLNQRPMVQVGQRVETGELIADGAATDHGELALGQNVLVAFMPWGGYNFEDAILISENLVKDDRYTSIHIEEFDIEVRDTKLGKEEITREIPNVGEEALKNLDESGIIRIGAEVKPGDILVGKVTPKGETQLTPEEKLLRAIFGEKAADVRDASLSVPPGIDGVVVDVKVFSRKGVEKDQRTKDIEDEEVSNLKRSLRDEIKIVEAQKSKLMQGILSEHSIDDEPAPAPADIEEFGSIDQSMIKPQMEEIESWADSQIDYYQNIFHEKLSRLEKGGELPPGVIKLVKVYIAMKRKLSVGDKMAGRHGNKGVVSKILPQEDMPFLPDGTPVEIVLNPLGVPSRMNVGQILETHLGWAASALGLHMATPVFDGASVNQIKETLQEAGIPDSGRTILYDGRSGEPFLQEVTVGYIYILKLAHLVDDKIHARSIGPYSLVTQQPLGGKAQFGGQRFGEMEVWALEAYGAAYTLQEILTVKSDDVAGRTDAYEAIVKGEDLKDPGVPESFNVLVKELQSLCLDVELLKEEQK